MEGYIQSLFLLLSAMNVLVSSQDNQSMIYIMTEENGSGDSQSTLLPSSIDYTSTTSLNTSFSEPTVESVPSTTDPDLILLSLSQLSITMTLSGTTSLISSVLPSTTSASPAPSVAVSTPIDSQSPHILTSTITTTSSVIAPFISNVTRMSQFSTTITTVAHSINPSETGTDMPSVPLPVLIGVPAGALALISFLFIVCVLCCVRCRKKRRKYTIKTAKKGSGSQGNARRSTTPVAHDLKELTVKENSKNLKAFGLDEEATAGTFGIEFPETPRYGSNEDIPALIILNPVKPIEPSSNALWSQTLPTRNKIRKQTCSESDVPDQPDPGVLKPAKSIGAIDTMTRATDMANKINDGTSLTLLLPDVTKSDDTNKKKVIANDNEYDHLSPEDFPDLIGSTGYVFLEAAVTAATAAKQPSTEKSQAAESSAPAVEPEANEESIYLQPSSLPVPSQPPQHMVPRESTGTAADIITESVYDTPKSSGIDTLSSISPQESKPSTSSGIELSSLSSREISVEVPSHYDVPKSALSSFKVDASKQLGFSTQPNSVSCEASLVLSSPQENHYDSLGAHHAAARANSPPYYDIPKHLLMAKSGTSTGKKLDNAGSGEEKGKQKDGVDQLESSDEHVYCVPPDVAVNVIKPQQHKPLQAEASQTDSAEAVNTNSSASKPVPVRRKKNDNTPGARNSAAVPAPRPVKRPTNLTKNVSGSVSSSREDLLQEQEPKKDANLSPVAIPKPNVAKRPKLLPKSSTASVSSSSEDLLQEQGRKNGVPISITPTGKPVVARKPKVAPKNVSGSVTSSCEELLQDQEQREDSEPRNVTVNGAKLADSSNCALQEETASEKENKFKPKPKVIPRSQSRQGIIQELLSRQKNQQKSTDAVSSKVKPNKGTQSPKKVAPKQPPIPQRPPQRPPPNS